MRLTLLILSSLVLGLCAPFVLARHFQTPSSLQVGSFTFTVPATNPAVSVNTPGKAGTLALTSDIPIAPPGVNVVAGNATLATPVNIPGLNNPVCTVTPRYAISGNTLTVSSLDYVCVGKNN